MSFAARIASHQSGGHAEAPAASVAAPVAPPARAAHAAQLPARPAELPLDGALAHAVLQRRKQEESWWDTVVDTVGDALESMGSKIEEVWELAQYPPLEQILPVPGLDAWYDSKGLSAIRNGNGLLSRKKIPRGDKGAAALLKVALQAWGAETLGRDLLPSGTAGGFDAEAAAAVTHLQAYAGLAADGIVGPKTLGALDGYVSAASERAEASADEPWVDEGEVDPGTVPLSAGFSDAEEHWIKEVWALPEIRALFGLYPAVPRQILTRVDKIVSRKDGSLTGSQGIQREGGEEVEIADNAYNQPESWNVDRSDEAQFKSVLIHELFHVFEYWEDDADRGGLRVTTPHALVASMIALRFGWFIHPAAADWGADAQPECHFSWGALDAPDTAYYLPPYSPLRARKDDPSSWEASPDNRGAEEDVATCLGMYLGSEAGHDELLDRYPERYGLIDDYVQELRAGAEGRV